ncbi:hypothetical protein EHM76_01370 [bacterium]|nr:MAG: hypothetical protein EHM76_01370 [bacterium]
MAQPPNNFVFVPYVPIAFVYYNPQQDQAIQAPEQEEEFLDSQIDYNVELDKFLKMEEEHMKQAYRKKLFKTVLQGEVYSSSKK